MPPELSVVLPTYNEKENIAILIPRLSKALGGIAHEILVVDDDSPDGTRQMALHLAEKGHAVRVLTKKKKEGIGAALRAGYNDALGRLIASMDADLSFESADIVRLYREIGKGYDLVVGNRHAGKKLYETPKFSIWLKHLVSLYGNRVLRLLTRIPLGDFSANFRMIKKDVWQKIETVENTNTILFEMILKSVVKGYRVTGIPVTFKDRRLGESKLHLSVEAPKFLLKLIAYLWRYGKTLYFGQRSSAGM